VVNKKSLRYTLLGMFTFFSILGFCFISYSAGWLLVLIALICLLSFLFIQFGQSKANVAEDETLLPTQQDLYLDLKTSCDQSTLSEIVKSVNEDRSKDTEKVIPQMSLASVVEILDDENNKIPAMDKANSRKSGKVILPPVTKIVKEDIITAVETNLQTIGGNMNERHQGEIVRYGNTHRTIGEISSQTVNYFFHASYFRGGKPNSMPVLESEVSFEVRRSEKRPDSFEAYDIIVTSTPSLASSEFHNAKPSLVKGNYKQRPLYNWAFLRDEPGILRNLADLALEENWEYDNSPDSSRPLPILYNYFHYTFERLQHEKKVLEVNSAEKLAAFNTGLVDKRYEPIYALFVPNERQNPKWKFKCFCIAGEDKGGKDLVRYFADRPKAAQYFERTQELLYDVEADVPTYDAEHILIERFSRLPEKFVVSHCGDSIYEVVVGENNKIDKEKVEDWFAEHQSVYNQMNERLKSAVNLSVKRVRWNYKTAIPTYTPRKKRIDLLLPLCLVNDRDVDLALVVENCGNGNCLGHTVLPLDWAYNNARLVCRPDSDWLTPTVVITIDDNVEMDEA
jgi:Domain of unknown function (DUF3825)